jgi:hypothetical protein
MKTPKTRALLSLAALCLAFTSADAQALRCSHRLITEGDRTAKVLRYCGEPIAVDSRYAERAYRSRRGDIYLPGFFEDVLVEEWTYNFGPRRFMRLVRFENGVVTDIEQLGYGFPLE